jgi:DNA-3-methyladenine glycosylase I
MRRASSPGASSPAGQSVEQASSSALARCGWAKDEDMIHYHDTEWGVPLHDEFKLFEALVLDGAQAGLSWQTILRKREAYRAAFDQFDPEKVAGYGAAQIKRLLANEGIVRNRMKIESAIRNARAFLIVQKEFGTFDKYIWGFVDGEPIINRRRSISEVPATSPISDALSKDLKQRGFTFVGTTICYAMMQAIGMVNDHLTSCFRYDALAGKSRRK